MLHWFARRLKEIHEKDSKGEKGFTLIELLVVIIIIGILAAIAIPVFLAQRERAMDADAESEARNIAAASTSYFADNNSYNGMTLALLAQDHGYNESGNNTVDEPAVYGGGNGFDVNVQSASGTDFNYDSDRGTVAEGASDGASG